MLVCSRVHAYQWGSSYIPEALNELHDMTVWHPLAYHAHYRPAIELGNHAIEGCNVWMG